MAGYAGIDNGYARFDRVRIPRWHWHMLSKLADVTKDERQPVHPGQTTACENQFRRTQSLQYVI